MLRHAQGRLSELEPSLARSVHEFPALLRFRCALAHAYAAIGNQQAARAALDDVLARDPEHHYVDAELSSTQHADPNPATDQPVAAG